MPEIVLRHFWLVFMAAVCLNAFVFWRRSKRQIAKRPELAPGYRKLVRGTLFWGNLPWVVMGMGCVLGGLRVDDFLLLRLANPYVLAWYVCVIALWALGFYWIVVASGAEMLAKHPGMLNFEIRDPRTIRWLCWGLLLAGVLGATVLFLQDVPYSQTQRGGYKTVFVIYDGFWRVMVELAFRLAIGVAIVAVATVWIRRLRIQKWWSDKKGTAPGFLLFFAVLWLVVHSVGYGCNFPRWFRWLSVYGNGQAEVVEGLVRVGHRQPAGGHAKGDMVRVAGKHFVVDYFRVTPVYKQTIAHDGHLVEGAYVRLWHSEGKILRVDVRTRTPASSPAPTATRPSATGPT